MIVRSLSTNAAACWEMPKRKGNLQGKGWRWGTAYAFPFRVQRKKAKGLGLGLNCFVPCKLTAAELYSVFAALGGKASLKRSCPSFPSAFLPAPPFHAWGSMACVRQSQEPS